MLKRFTNLLGDSNERVIKDLQQFVDKINELEPNFQALTDQELRDKTTEFRSRLKQGETLEDLLIEAFATVREASVRSIGLRHFDVQLLGGVASVSYTHLRAHET